MPNSRRKGKGGELEVAGILRKHGYGDARRTAQYCGNTGDAADVVGVPGLHIECKRVERLNLYAAMEQAMRDSAAAGKGDVPVVVHRKNGHPWLVTLAFEDYLDQLGGGANGTSDSEG